MQLNNSDDMTHVMTVIVNFEGEGKPGSHLYLYLFNHAGKLIECQPILYGKVMIVLSKSELVNARIFIGLPEEKPERFNVSQDRMPALLGHEVTLGRECGENNYALSPVPDSVWQQWTIEHLWIDDHSPKKVESRAIKFRPSANVPSI